MHSNVVKLLYWLLSSSITCTHTHTHTRTVAVVTGLQIAIAVLGGFRKSRLDQYVGCLEASLQAVVDQDMNVDGLTLPDNVTYPVSRPSS